MKINPKYKLRKVAGESIIVQQGKVGADLTKVISLNDSACLLFEKLSKKDFTVKDAADILLENYEIDEETASRDAAKWVDSLKKCNLITE